jgi:hypothetical protein
MPEKDREDQLVWLCEKEEVLLRVKEKKNNWLDWSHFA